MEKSLALYENHGTTATSWKKVFMKPQSYSQTSLLNLRKRLKEVFISRNTDWMRRRFGFVRFLKVKNS